MAHAPATRTDAQRWQDATLTRQLALRPVHAAVVADVGQALGAAAAELGAGRSHGPLRYPGIDPVQCLPRRGGPGCQGPGRHRPCRVGALPGLADHLLTGSWSK